MSTQLVRGVMGLLMLLMLVMMGLLSHAPDAAVADSMQTIRIERIDYGTIPPSAPRFQGMAPDHDAMIAFAAPLEDSDTMQDR